MSASLFTMRPSLTKSCPSRHVACKAAETRTATPKVRNSNQKSLKTTQEPKPTSDEDDIYIGQGKFIKDNPAKYPSKDGLGVGGWAGGEAGLWQFREEVERTGTGTIKKTPRAPGTQTIRKGKLGGDDLVYVGRGEYVKDDERKYATKESLDSLFGQLTGATGGFSGGEVGVKQFVEKGDLSIADASTIQKRQKQRDLIFVGSLVLLAGAGGGLLAYASTSGVIHAASLVSEGADTTAGATAAVAQAQGLLTAEQKAEAAALLAGLGGAVYGIRKVDEMARDMVKSMMGGLFKVGYAGAVAVVAYYLILKS